MIEFITQNSNLLEVILVLAAGLFGFVKWIDSRNHNLKEKRFETYMNLVNIISGKRSDSSTPNIPEQIAATWFLLEYKEYYETTKKIFADTDLKKMANESWILYVLPHIEKLLKEIS